MRGSHFPRTFLRIVLFSLAGALVALGVIALWPAPSFPVPAPAFPSYEEARNRAAELLARPAPGVRPECRSLVLDQGHRTRDVYVLLHGLTNCPAQFRAFADQLHARGANVLMLRLPHHGLSDRMNVDQAQLTAVEMLASANQAVDLARGYGERVIVVGLSVSGVTAAWLAQTRKDVDLAVVIAPFLAPAHCPEALVAPLAHLLCRLPNAFVWWDSGQRENLAGSPFSYPRFATQPLGEVLAIGLDVFSRARRAPPAARRILLVTSATDTAISLPRARALAALWGARCRVEEFPADWNVPHDCIDPRQPGSVVARVYPQLIAWIDETLAAAVFPSPRPAAARD